MLFSASKASGGSGGPKLAHLPQLPQGNHQWQLRVHGECPFPSQLLHVSAPVLYIDVSDSHVLCRRDIPCAVWFSFVVNTFSCLVFTCYLFLVLLWPHCGASANAACSRLGLSTLLQMTVTVMLIFLFPLQNYHSKCFICTGCSKKLENEFTEINGWPWCKDCMSSMGMHPLTRHSIY